MDIDPHTVKQAAPGLAGAIGAIFFLKGSWALKIGLVVPGGFLAYYGHEDLATFTGMNQGLAGFSIGLLGMIFIAKVIDTWNSLDLGTILMQWLRKLLRLQQ